MTFFRAALTAALFLPSLLYGKETDPRTQEEIEAATRLQVFLDRADFGPGKIDGHYGEFTRHALSLYRQSKGLPPLPAPEAKSAAKTKSEPAPDVSDLDLKATSPFTDYTVTEADVKASGELPTSIPAQAKLKWLPYRTVAEGIAEKFHADLDFIGTLNPGLALPSLKAGDKVKVPNVEPFLLESVKTLKPGSEVASQGVNDLDDDGKEDKEAKETKESAPLTTSVKVNTTDNMLQVFDKDKLIAAYPVTIGSARTVSPLGDWKVRGVARLPDFRYDEKMLKEGERSDEFHLLKPGPNNLVGVVWIALNKKGIGIHGTSEPDSIGRSASHGCIRLANWDIARLAVKVRAGVPVSIH